uniref:DNA helicase Pif1-like 2B domain-containing protein n=1 Tax=Octopus bimaculoides TaxID=37653 RepID=A0A0L8H019_OCTBM
MDERHKKLRQQPALVNRKGPILLHDNARPHTSCRRSFEFINKFTPSGFPPHILKLKKKRCIMFLRNLDATNGNCNGTQYITVSLNDHVIEAKVASGPYAESTLLISRIPLVSQEMEFTFTFTRKQFPVKPAFALTCNKVHKQTLEQIGIYLPTQFFSHGQLYVALPRV